MASSFGSGVSASVQSLIQTIGQALGKDFDFSQTDKFRILLETYDGNNIVAQAFTLDKGPNPTIKTTLEADLAVPSGGSAEGDISFGTGTLVASTVEIAVPDPGDVAATVPTDAVLYAVATTEGGNAKSLHIERIDDDTIRVSSDGAAYVGPVESDTGLGTAVAGTLDVVMNDAVLATDLIFVEEVTAGGGAADHFSGFRKDADEITIQAHTAAGALVATNTSAFRIHKVAASYNGKNRAVGTCVAGAVTVSLTNAVGDRLFVRETAAGGTAANHFVAFRAGAGTVTIHAVQADGSLQTANTSSVEVYNAGPVDCANGTCVAGTVDVLMTVVAADRLSVVELATGGDPADHFSVFRKDADEVTVQAHDAAGALVATNTSVVRVYNMGQAADETSSFVWMVRRP